MVAINLDPLKEEQLRSLARSRGEDVEAIARRILEDYLDFNSLTEISPDDWAESSAQLAVEVLPPDEWSESEKGQLGTQKLAAVDIALRYALELS